MDISLSLSLYPYPKYGHKFVDLVWPSLSGLQLNSSGHTNGYALYVF